jgi:hypothetical protein
MLLGARVLLECLIPGGGEPYVHPAVIDPVVCPGDQAGLLEPPEPGRQRAARQAEQVGEL